MLNKEHAFVPYFTSELPQGPWLVFSPHADDETYGMGGTLLKAASKGIEIHLVVLTDGALGGDSTDLVSTRREEVENVAKILGSASLDCWAEKDRGLNLTNELVARVVEKIKSSAPGAVFFPGPMEIHPDHRNASLLVWSAITRLDIVERPKAFSYEISVQNPINFLVDISKEREAKSTLMSVYASQNRENNYEDLVRALDIGRTFSLPPEVECAEGFYEYTEEQLKCSLEETLLGIVKSYLASVNDDET